MEQSAENIGQIIPPPVSNVILQTMPNLGPAPNHLPPLVNPPPPLPLSVPLVTNQSIIEAQTEPSVPVQAQFETLNLNSPSASIPQPVNNEFITFPPTLVDGDSTASPPIDSNGESLVVPEEEGKSGTSSIPSPPTELFIFLFHRSSKYHSSEYVDTQRYQRIQRSNSQRKRCSYQNQ